MSILRVRLTVGLRPLEAYILVRIQDPQQPCAKSRLLQALRGLPIIQPKVIATLGRFSMEYMMKKFGLESELESVSKIYGRIFDSQTDCGDVKIIPLYHPAVALYNGSQIDVLKKDFRVLKSVL